MGARRGDFYSAGIGSVLHRHHRRQPENGPMAPPRRAVDHHQQSQSLDTGPRHPQELSMSARHTLAAIVTAVAALTMVTGCAVTRGQSTVGEYIDDTAITTAVKAKLVESKQVDAVAVSVETLDGTVMLSGFAKSQDEKNMAESIARSTKGVKSVKNQLSVRG
jgi:osmotically-inducible protein OsmY